MTATSSNDDVDATTPAARYGAAAAFDGERIILFGGNRKYLTNETWAFDATGWTQLKPPNRPSARLGSSMAFDGKRAVLFGGNDASTYYDDTWIFDGVTWTQVKTASGPPARSNAGMAYDGQRLVLFGGIGSGGGPILQDTWAFDGVYWSEVKAAPGPGARWGMGLAYTGNGEQAALFGGINHQELGDTWFFDETPEWVLFQPLNSPSARSRTMMANAPVYPWDVFLFGGCVHTGNQVSSILGDTWGFRVNEAGGDWTQLTSGGPSPRYAAAFAADPSRNLVMLFGGNQSPIGPIMLGDTWTFDGEAWTEWT